MVVLWSVQKNCYEETEKTATQIYVAIWILPQTLDILLPLPLSMQ